MTEFELKLEIPDDRLEAVSAAMQRGDLTRQRLQARYFDTPDRALAGHGVVVRLRREGQSWVQTAKAPGNRPLERLEHNVLLTSRTAPVIDLALHQGSEAGKRIGKALKLKRSDPFPALELVYKTDITRCTRTVTAGSTTVEIALDTGHISAGRKTWPIHELELELKQGDTASAVELARAWSLEQDLWLSSVSKSMKGERLAAGQRFAPAATAREPRFDRRASASAMFAAVLGACLEQVMDNASDMAAGSSNAEHIHQLRVGLRRLRTALRELGGAMPGIDPQWEPALVEVFRALGQHRDRSHLQLTLQRQLEALGGPPLDWRESLAELPDAGKAVRSPAFQQALLGLIGHVHAQSDDSRDESALKIARKRLDKLHRRVVRDGQQFLSLDEAAQHSLRKRLKRLRYLAEFSRPLFNARRTEQFVDALKPLQDAMGVYNDELTSLQAWRDLAPHDPRAWFGIGWLTGRRADNAQTCQQACAAFSLNAKPFWKRT